MSRIDEINEQIEALQASKRRIQEECSHPSECVMKTAGSSAGGYDAPCYDKYWYHLHCTLCDKKWTEDQDEWNAKERERKLTNKSPAEG